MSAEPSEVVQCRTCPWRVGADPFAIPDGYAVELHRALSGTIARPGEIRIGCALRVMVCHYSKPGQEYPCAGWLENQLGTGNNLALRLALIRGQVPVPRVDGEQHQRFEDTLPGGD